MAGKDEKNKFQTITEGKATVKTKGDVFYNPVQEFNRDLSILALSVFARDYKPDCNKKSRKSKKQETPIIEDTQNEPKLLIVGQQCENGITILEALSATGLRSIRYAKEIPGIKKIVANDISRQAVESIAVNIKENGVSDLVETSHCDAFEYMCGRRQKATQFDAIDLDPYGCPSTFLAGAVQAVVDGGLLLVTATDMAVLCGNCPETCRVKYMATSLNIKSCHEMALRILLQTIESHANTYGRYIEPMLSLSADFYIRVIVRVFSSNQTCKYSSSKLSNVFHCTGCDSWVLQPLGAVKREGQRDKFILPKINTPIGQCEHCGLRQRMGGPIWTAPIHNKEFVGRVSEAAVDSLGTCKRIRGVLGVILEELDDIPLYYILGRLTSCLHCESPPMLKFRSAILHAGYRVSYSHCHRLSIKTDAPGHVIWDIMRTWIKTHPIKKEHMVSGSVTGTILGKEPNLIANFELHEDANPETRRQGFVRFQENPTSHWGPGTRATAMVGEEKISKSRRNQNKNAFKRKRNTSNESMSDDNKKLEIEANNGEKIERKENQ